MARQATNEYRISFYASTRSRSPCQPRSRRPRPFVGADVSSPSTGALRPTRNSSSSSAGRCRVREAWLSDARDAFGSAGQRRPVPAPVLGHAGLARPLDRAGPAARPTTVVRRLPRPAGQRGVVLAQQQRGSVPAAHDRRRRRGAAPPARRSRHRASRAGARLLDGRAAGLGMGSALPGTGAPPRALRRNRADDAARRARRRGRSRGAAKRRTRGPRALLGGDSALQRALQAHAWRDAGFASVDDLVQRLFVDDFAALDAENLLCQLGKWTASRRLAAHEWRPRRGTRTHLGPDVCDPALP